MYELARALVQDKGAPITLGFGMVREFRAGHLTIHYLPKSGQVAVRGLSGTAKEDVLTG